MAYGLWPGRNRNAVGRSRTRRHVDGVDRFLDQTWQRNRLCRNGYRAGLASRAGPCSPGSRLLAMGGKPAHAVLAGRLGPCGRDARTARGARADCYSIELWLECRRGRRDRHHRGHRDGDQDAICAGRSRPVLGRTQIAPDHYCWGFVCRGRVHRVLSGSRCLEFRCTCSAPHLERAFLALANFHLVPARAFCGRDAASRASACRAAPLAHAPR